MPRIAAFSAICLSLVAAGCQRVPLLAPTGSTITLTASTTALPSNGATQLIAQILEASGTPPHSGTHIIFTTTLGTIEPAEMETDVNGRAVTTFRAGNSNGTATITASSGGASVAAANAVKIAVGIAAVGGLSLNASPTTISANGGTSTITASVVDTAGNALPSVPVTFTVDVGSVDPSSATTDANGRATTTLRASRTAKVTATAGIASGSGTGAVPAPTKDVTVTVNTTNTITVGAITPATPTVGQTVSIPLTYGTTGSPLTSLRVDWGDGSAPQTFSGQPASVSHKYASAGSYLVTITGTDSFGDSANTSASVTVAPKPQLTVDVTPSGTFSVGNPITFAITATPTTGAAITSVSIDFNDGSAPITLSGNLKSAVHTYINAGTFVVSATATDSSGAVGSGSAVIVIAAATPAPTPTPTPTPAPVAAFTFSPSTQSAGNAVSFNAATSTGTGLTYSWDFGDLASGASNTSTLAAPQHTFGVANSYVVTLTVTDSSGRTSSVSRNVIIS